MTWSLQSLKDAQLSCPAKLETVVRRDVGQLSFNASLSGRKKKKKNQVKSNTMSFLLPVIDLTCVVIMQEGSDMAPKRRQLTLRRTVGSTGVSRKYKRRSTSIPRRIPAT